jgi:hypothetical protein
MNHNGTHVVYLRDVLLFGISCGIFVYITLGKGVDFHAVISLGSWRAMEVYYSRTICTEFAPTYEGQVTQGSETACGCTPPGFLRGPFANPDWTTGF